MLSLLGWASARARSCQQNVRVVRMWRQLHGGPASGVGIERVFFSAGKQHDALKKSTMDKTLESTLKTPSSSESSPMMMMTHTGNASSLQWQEVGRRKGAKEPVVIWAYSVALVWLV
jgi:hypothetical protein